MEIVAAADAHNPATAERPDISHSHRQPPCLDRIGQQTCDRTPTIPSPPELENPFVYKYTQRYIALVSAMHVLTFALKKICTPNKLHHLEAFASVLNSQKSK